MSKTLIQKGFYKIIKTEQSFYLPILPKDGMRLFFIIFII
jgi:hypothetical protein